MVVVDANVLLYAVDASSPHHDESRDWLDRSLGGEETVGFAWTVLLAFLRLGSSPAVFPSPMTVPETVAQIQAWLGAPAAVVVEPGFDHAAMLGRLLESAGAGGNLASDAHLAALAIEQGADVVSFDRDFDRFEGVVHRRPGG